MRHDCTASLGWLLLSIALAGCGGAPDALTAPAAERRVGQSVSASETAALIDALFLGSGPLIPRDGLTACPAPRLWTGFPRGTAVRVRVSSTVPAEAQAALRQAAGQVASATNRVITASLEVTSVADPLPGSDEVTVTVHPDPRGEGCASARGCIQQTFRGRGLLAAGRALASAEQPVQALVRDVVGRGILGMCLIDARLIGGAGHSLMAAGRGLPPDAAAGELTELDVAAARAVYASSLTPGATRRDFLAAGLVNLQAGERRRPSATN